RGGLMIGPRSQVCTLALAGACPDGLVPAGDGGGARDGKGGWEKGEGPKRLHCCGGWVRRAGPGRAPGGEPTLARAAPGGWAGEPPLFALSRELRPLDRQCESQLAL